MKKNKNSAISGLILAGGLAERMGSCKALLPVPRESSLEVIVSRMRDSGIGSITVVTGGHDTTVRREALRLDCVTAHNPAYASGMFSSVIAGMKALPQNAEAFFLLPVDIPLVKVSTYKSMIDAFYEGYDSPDVVYPTFMGERGHPPLIGRTMGKTIIGWRGAGGLRGALEKCSKSLDLPTADRAVLLDMDTQDDYAAMLRYARGEKFPDESECAELLSIAGTPDRVARHMKVVARCAMSLLDALRAADDKWLKLNPALLLSACLLHDIAKGRKNHEAEGARWLRNRGYHKVAKVVVSHKDLPDSKSLGEAEILYLSDKITDGETVSTLKHRMLKMEARFAPGSEALSMARRRIRRAAEIQEKIEKIIGFPIGRILEG
jgi:CTP:molybdopterin cytidylyltransferase MocA